MSWKRDTMRYYLWSEAPYRRLSCRCDNQPCRPILILFIVAKCIPVWRRSKPLDQCFFAPKMMPWERIRRTRILIRTCIRHQVEFVQELNRYAHTTVPILWSCSTYAIHKPSACLNWYSISATVPHIIFLKQFHESCVHIRLYFHGWRPFILHQYDLHSWPVRINSIAIRFFHSSKCFIQSKMNAILQTMVYVRNLMFKNLPNSTLVLF